MKRLFVVCALVLTALCCRPAFCAELADKPRIDVYFEAASQNSWQMLLILNAVETRMPGRLAISAIPLVMKDKNGGFSAGTTGQEGLDEAARMLTMRKLYTDRAWFYAVGRSMSPWADGWRDAAQYAGVSPERLETGVSQVSKNELALAADAQERIGLRFPMLFINDEPYSGEYGLIPLLTAFNNALPKVKRVNIPQSEFSEKNRAYVYVVVADDGKGPAGKEDPQLSAGIKRIIKQHRPIFRTVSYSKLAGMPEFKGVNADFLPFYSIKDNPAVAKTLDYPIKNGLIVKQGEMLVIKDTGRPGVFINRERKPRHLDIFVMAQCPFCSQVIGSLIENRKNKTLPADVTMDVHYIVSVTTSAAGPKFESLHGTAEWEEDARQLLIKEKFPDKFWKYIAERDKDYKSSLWESAAEKAGIPPAEVKAQFEYGKQLLQKDAAYANELGIGASPTLLWEGRTILAGYEELKKIPGFEKLNTTMEASGQH